jgi:hypothetical protein
MASRFRLTAPFLLLLLAGPAVAQLPVAAPGGVLSGVVRDSVTGAPVGFALLVLVERDQRVFANAAGRFSFEAVGSGNATLRIQQIGYRAVVLSLKVDARQEGTPAAGPGLTIFLNRQPFRLPEIVVSGDACTAAQELVREGEETLLGEMFKNAERLLTLSRDYPFRETYQESTAAYDSISDLIGGRVDTSSYDSRTMQRYRRGRVIDRSRPGSETALYFQAVDLAQDDFRRNHCFWYSGLDTLDGYRAYRIQFAPIQQVKSIDWSGHLLIDSATMVLVRSEAHLVNLPPKGTTFESGSCVVLYQQIFPTLVSPKSANCLTRRKGKPPYTGVARWKLINFVFLRRSPNQAEPPPRRPSG